MLHCFPFCPVCNGARRNGGVEIGREGRLRAQIGAGGEQLGGGRSQNLGGVLVNEGTLKTRMSVELSSS